MRIDEQTWPAVDAALEERGYALLPRLLEPAECDAFTRAFAEDARYRKTIEMGLHAYGDGRYRYFAYPLPDALEELRSRLYERLLPIARTWLERLGRDEAFPDRLDDFLGVCHRAGQRRPTPLVLRYEADGYNRMHQDVYGDVSFPLQVACLLSSPGDFEGGEFLVSESRPRMQTRTEAVPLARGEGIVFANDVRPVVSKRGYARARMRHGLSRIRSGTRYALGVIFHDAA
jgi:hypothetical protein